MSGRGTAAGVRSEAQAYPATPPDATCPCQDPHRKLHAGVFFDGTNNNKDRDRPHGKHTNVVRLWSVYREFSTAEAIHKKKYVDGVGSMDTSARGRQAVRETVQNTRWYNPPLTAAAASAGRYVADMGHNAAGLMGGAGGKERLNRAYFWLKGECAAMPRPGMKTVDVYGFSRGAALARTFVNLVNMALRREEPNITVRFVGVYDTVGSFGVAGDDSDPGQNMYIDGTDAAAIEHFTARHEFRQNFPLTVITGVDREYAGAHSDVGGGYEPVDADGRVNHLAMIPFKDMHTASVRAGVRMDPWERENTERVPVEELRARAERYAGAGPSLTAPDSPWLRERAEFFNTYIHESASANNESWWRTGLAVAAYRRWVDPHRRDSSGARRKFTPRRFRLKGMPPGFDWE